jgi:hypothetical protein
MNWLIICACAKSGRGFVQFRSRTKKNVDTALPPRWTQRTNHTSHPPPHTRRNTHEHTHTARMASSVRDKLLTTYLGASECIGCGARQAGGAVLPGWLRREPYDRRAFTGKVCTRKRLPPSGAWPGAWPGAAALTCLCSAACGGRQAARAQRTAAAGAALPYSPPPPGLASGVRRHWRRDRRRLRRQPGAGRGGGARHPGLQVRGGGQGARGAGWLPHQGVLAGWLTGNGSLIQGGGERGEQGGRRPGVAAGARGLPAGWRRAGGGRAAAAAIVMC